MMSVLHAPWGVVYSPGYTLDMSGQESVHPFDVRKYMKIVDLLHADGLLDGGAIIEPDLLTEQEAALVHTPDYMRLWTDPETMAEIFEVDYLRNVSPDTIRERYLPPYFAMAGGTVRAAREALQCGTAFNIGGGFHHAHADHGSGFCFVADVAIAVRLLIGETLIRRAAIVDCDVHQGDGNATIFAGDPSVFTLSFHQEDIFPFEKATSSRDVPFPAGTGDEAYMALLREHVPDVLDTHRPDILFYVAGSDVHADDPLAAAELTSAGIVQRDAYVWREARKRGIPFVMVLAGGYFPRCPEVHAASIGNIIRKARKQA